MSHGKKNNNQSKLDRANEFIARLMGKRSNNVEAEDKQPKNNSVKKNDFVFLSIFIGVGLLIWGLTGICYVPDDSYGVVIQNGKPKKILTENSLILTYPYPINDFNTFNLEVSKIDFGTIESSAPLMINTQYGSLVQNKLIFDISIDNPQKFYLNFYQVDKNSINRLKTLASGTINRYFNNHTYTEIQDQNKIVTANELSSNLNSDLEQYGIKVSKLNLTQVVLVDSESQRIDSMESNPVESSAILQQAYQYRNVIETKINSKTQDYYSLLKQYNSNPQIVAELLYYRALANNNQKLESSGAFPLLNLSESEYMSGVNQQIDISNQDSRQNLRTVNRNVLRERTFNDQ